MVPLMDDVIVILSSNLVKTWLSDLFLLEITPAASWINCAALLSWHQGCTALEKKKNQVWVVTRVACDLMFSAWTASKMLHERCFGTRFDMFLKSVPGYTVQSREKKKLILPHLYLKKKSHNCDDAATCSGFILLLSPSVSWGKLQWPSIIEVTDNGRPDSKLYIAVSVWAQGGVRKTLQVFLHVMPHLSLGWEDLSSLWCS